MINSILNLSGAEFFVIAFGLVAVLSNKDLAWYCFGASLMSMLVHDSGMAYEPKVVSYAAITCTVAIGSSWHYRIAKYTLSLAVCIICCLTLINQAVQIITWTSAGFFISNSLGVMMLISLVFMDGRKDLINDLADDFGLHTNNGSNSHGGSSNGKGGQ